MAEHFLLLFFKKEARAYFLICLGRRYRRAPPSGFTLLEVLIALAIAAPALVLLFRSGADSLTAIRTSSRYEEAISRAKSRLAALAGQPLETGEQSGSEGGGFSWHTVIARLAATPPPHDGSDVSGTALFDVSVDVSWPVGSQQRTVRLVSRRLGPARARAP